MLYYKLKNFDLAIKNYTTAIELDSKLQVAYLNRGTLYLDIEKYDEAESDFKTAISLKDIPVLHMRMAELYQMKGNIEKALYAISNALLLDPKVISAFFFLFHSRCKHFFCFQFKAGFVYKGHLFTLQKSFSLALDCYNTAINLDPKFVRAYKQRSKCHEVMGNKQLAEQDKEMYEKLELESKQQQTK